MIRPPVAGMHGRHRAFGTPGPTGWNDHGDPCHASQAGPTPGSLGVNDHGTPLPGPSPLLLPKQRQDNEAHTNQITEKANVTAHSRTEQKLQASLGSEGAHGSNGLQVGGVEYRAAGTFFQSLGSQGLSGSPLGLSYQRVGQALPGRDAAEKTSRIGSRRT
jgi:hypothetical protein